YCRSVRALRLAAAAVLVVSCAAPALVGTEITPTAAPDFTLTDGISGNAVRLSAQQGSVVVLAFLYTQCPDVCPLTAERFRQAQRQLTDDVRSHTLFVAVSVDPVHDTPAAVQTFARDHGLATGFVFLVGGSAQLQPVWSAYGIRVATDPSAAGVGHSDAIYLLDRKGQVRLLTHSDITPEALAGDIKALSAER
ncbi:MAG TPA: SCO family protein, partial [Candidatus Limnocylindria bacterium]|nr:SCO family protein [Candidatus Limnocylindria bacterium]